MFNSKPIAAAELAPLLDRDLSDWTPESLREAYLRYGCAVIRRAVPADLIERTRAAIDKAYQSAPGDHVYNKQIKAASGGALTGYELVGDPKLKRFLDLVYSGQLYFRKNATARRIQGNEGNPNWQEPLAFHIDAQFHRFPFTVNFWVPLEDCGVDAPSLQVLPLDYLSTRAYSGYTGHLLRPGEPFRFGYFANRVFDPDVVIAAFGESAFLRPAMRAGDLILSSNWIIHGSYRTPAMHKGRTSVELRFIGTDLDIAPHLPPLMTRVASALTGRAHRNFARASATRTSAMG
jgi:ectoine hydroxylase-related dioxygenase (phytanoyl-CoA dioxygenase family)